MRISPDNDPQDIIDTIEALARQRTETAQPGPQPRAQAETKAQINWRKFAEVRPAEAGWITRHEASFEFAAAMRAAVERWADLTGKQAEAVRKCMAREAARQARPAAADLDQGSVAALRDCFDRAAANKAYGAAPDLHRVSRPRRTRLRLPDGAVAGHVAGDRAGRLHAQLIEYFPR